MNFDFTRGALNREKVFYEESFNSLKSVPGPEETKKQLPLRQQTSKLTIKNNDNLKAEDTLAYSSNNTGKILSPCQIHNNENGDSSKKSLSRSKRTSSFSNPFSKPVTAVDVKNIFDDKVAYKSVLVTSVNHEISEQNFKRNVFLRPVNSSNAKNSECLVRDANMPQLQNSSPFARESTTVEKKYLKSKFLDTMFYFASTHPLSTIELQIQNSNNSQGIQPSKYSNLVHSLPLQTKEDYKPPNLFFKSQAHENTDIQKVTEIPCETSDGMSITDSNVESFLSRHPESIKANTGEESSLNYSNFKRMTTANVTAGNNHEERHFGSVADPFDKSGQLYKQERENQNLIAVEKILLPSSSGQYTQVLYERPVSAYQLKIASGESLNNVQQSLKESVLITQPIQMLLNESNTNQSERKQSNDRNYSYQQVKPVFKSRESSFQQPMNFVTRDEYSYNEQHMRHLQEQLRLKSEIGTIRQHVKQISLETDSTNKKLSPNLQHMRPVFKDSIKSSPHQGNILYNDQVTKNSMRNLNSEIQTTLKREPFQQQTVSLGNNSNNAGRKMQPFTKESNSSIVHKKTGSAFTFIANQDHPKFVQKDLQNGHSEHRNESINEGNGHQQEVIVSRNKTVKDVPAANPVRIDSQTLILKLAKEQQKKLVNHNPGENKKLKRFSITKVKSFPQANESYYLGGDGLAQSRPTSAKNIIQESRKAVDIKAKQVNEINNGDFSDSNQDTESETEPGSEFSQFEERQLGDGESSDDGGEEEALESNCEDYTSDAGSDSYSTNSTKQQTTSNSVVTLQETNLNRSLQSISSSTVVTRPAFIYSLFKNIPPTLNFVSEGEKTETLPYELRKLMKWKLSPITPIVVKSAISRIGFKITKKNFDWLGCFGKHMKSQCFRQLRDFQKLNHFPGSFNIGRKDKLWRNLSRMQTHFGKKEFSFFPHTFILPSDTKLLKRIWEEGSGKQKWIVKPPASARGQGIRVINKWSQVPRKRAMIVQKYIHNPYLINGSKFDMRIYVYVSSYDPLRLYVYNEGLARFASCKYSSSSKTLANRFIHLTNYSVNKKNTQYLSNSDTSICEGHKWSLKALWEYLKGQGVNTTAVWNSIKDLIIKTIISGDSSINSTIKAVVHNRYCVHELFGFDVLLDSNCKPWILEVNISPSLHSNSKLDVEIKSELIKDMMNLSGIRLPDPRDTHVHANSSEIDFSKYTPPNNFCMDKRLFTTQLSPDERAKHAYFCQKFQDERPFMSLLAVNKNSIVEAFVLKHHVEVMQSILDVITPDDLRHLCESIDEDNRKGNFQRLFPTPQTHNYLRYFEQPRYYNLLLDQWVLRYNRMEQKGIMLLQSLCEENLHLENPTCNPKHQWEAPNTHMLRSVELKHNSSSTSVISSQSSSSLDKSDLTNLTVTEEESYSRIASTTALPKIVRHRPKQMSKSDSKSSSLASSSSPGLYTASSSTSSATLSR